MQTSQTQELTADKINMAESDMDSCLQVKEGKSEVKQELRSLSDKHIGTEGFSFSDVIQDTKINIDVKPENPFQFGDILDVKHEPVSSVEEEQSDTNLEQEQEQADNEVEEEQADTEKVQVEDSCDNLQGESQCFKKYSCKVACDFFLIH